MLRSRSCTSSTTIRVASSKERSFSRGRYLSCRTRWTLVPPAVGFEPDLVSNQRTKSLPSLLGHSLSDTGCGGTTRLGTDNITVGSFSPVDTVVRNWLRDPCGFSRSSGSHPYGHTVVSGVVQQLLSSNSTTRESGAICCACIP